MFPLVAQTQNEVFSFGTLDCELRPIRLAWILLIIPTLAGSKLSVCGLIPENSGKTSETQ